MTALMQKAIEALQRIPEEDQDRVAAHILEDLTGGNGHARLTGEPGDKPIWEKLRDRGLSVPDEEWAAYPKDGAAELDHYLYGSPKRNT